jgi:hypothetical protein
MEKVTMTQFCTVCRRAVSATTVGRQVRYNCACGANHILLRGADGTSYLARVFPVVKDTIAYGRNTMPDETARIKGNA